MNESATAESKVQNKGDANSILISKDDTLINTGLDITSFSTDDNIGNELSTNAGETTALQSNDAEDYVKADKDVSLSVNNFKNEKLDSTSSLEMKKKEPERCTVFVTEAVEVGGNEDMQNRRGKSRRLKKNRKPSPYPREEIENPSPDSFLTEEPVDREDNQGATGTNQEVEFNIHNQSSNENRAENKDVEELRSDQIRTAEGVDFEECQPRVSRSDSKKIKRVQFNKEIVNLDDTAGRSGTSRNVKNSNQDEEDSDQKESIALAVEEEIITHQRYDEIASIDKSLDFDMPDSLSKERSNEDIVISAGSKKKKEKNDCKEGESPVCKSDSQKNQKAKSSKNALKVDYIDNMEIKSTETNLFEPNVADSEPNVDEIKFIPEVSESVDKEQLNTSLNDEVNEPRKAKKNKSKKIGSNDNDPDSQRDKQNVIGPLCSPAQKASSVQNERNEKKDKDVIAEADGITSTDQIEVSPLKSADPVEMDDEFVEQTKRPRRRKSKKSKFCSFNQMSVTRDDVLDLEDYCNDPSVSNVDIDKTLPETLPEVTDADKDGCTKKKKKEKGQARQIPVDDSAEKSHDPIDASLTPAVVCENLASATEDKNARSNEPDFAGHASKRNKRKQPKQSSPPAVNEQESKPKENKYREEKSQKQVCPSFLL
jgi:hypothetical protein